METNTKQDRKNGGRKTNKIHQKIDGKKNRQIPSFILENCLAITGADLK